MRLVTLSRPAGVGKTRLAAAAGVGDSFEDGVWFVGLSPIDDADLVAPVIARALGLREETGDVPLPERIAAFLRPQHLLLLLNNFEQVVEAAPFVADLLAARTQTIALITSRVRLRISGDRERPVGPLTQVEPALRATVEAAERSEAAGLRPHPQQCDVGGGDLPPAGRAAAGDRAGRRPDEGVSPGRSP